MLAEARGGSRTAATSKMKLPAVNYYHKALHGFQPLTIITKHSILDVAAVLDPPLEATSRRGVLTMVDLNSVCQKW